jgi:hypothetical protein
VLVVLAFSLSLDGQQNGSHSKSKAKFKLEIKIIKSVAHKMMNSLSHQQQRIGSGEGINILKIYNLKGKSKCEHYCIKEHSNSKYFW